MEEKLKKYRRELHQIPELSFDLDKTHAYVKEVLINLGYQPKVYAKTGLVVIKKGQSNQTYAFRADMDALPIKEANNISFASLHDGKMHACGHDGHTAMLLGFAEYVSKIDNPLHTIMLIFQPAEEGPGGAKVMIDEGIFKDYIVKGIFGLHLYPGLEEHTIGLKDGLMLAGNGEFEIQITGIAAHGATPNAGKDAILAGANLVTQLNQIVARYTKPMEPAVLTVGLFQGGDAKNIIPSNAKIEGSIRAFNEKTYLTIKKYIKHMSKGTEISYDVDITVNFKDLYPPVINDHKLFKLVDKLITKDKKVLVQAKTFSEDFAFYQEKVPGMFIFIGTKNKELDFINPLHSDKFNFDESVLQTGYDLYTKILNEINKVK